MHDPRGADRRTFRAPATAAPVSPELRAAAWRSLGSSSAATKSAATKPAPGKSDKDGSGVTACTCSASEGAGGSCAQCRAREGAPGKALTAAREDQGRKPNPYSGSATIQCDGAGDYEIMYNGWAGATCGTKDCVTAHESSHIADWKRMWPTGCKGQPKGYLPKGDPPDSPLMTAAEYKDFLKKSECTAHTVDLAAAKALPKSAACTKTIDDYIKLTEDQKAEWCGSSKVGQVLGGAAVGAATGGLIGAAFGGLPGALIGGAIGAIAGGITGALL
jgi:hypothetical protein